MKDNLEHFFNKHLNGEGDSSGDGDWNMPSDDVWENVASQIQKPKKNRKFPWVWFAILGLFVGLIWLSNYITQLENKFENIRKTTVEKTRNADIEKHVSAPLNVEKDLDIKSTEIIQHSSKLIPPKRIKEHIQKNKGQKVFKQIPSNKKNSTENRKNTKQSLPIAKTVNKDKIKIDRLAFRTISPVIIQDKKIKLAQVPSQKAISESNHWELAVFYGPTGLRTPLSGNISDRGDIYNSYNFGIEIGYEVIPNLSLNSGLAYRKIISNYERSATMDYNANKEYQNSDGEMENLVPMTIPSPLGDVQTMNTLTHPIGASVNGKMELDMYLHQVIQYFSIPLELKYSWNAGHRFRVNLSSGAALNKPISHSANYKMNLKNHTMKMSKPTIMRLEKINSILWTYELGLGLQYDIYNNLSIFTKASYFHNLNPIYSNNGVDTGLEGVDVRMGLGLRF